MGAGGELDLSNPAPEGRTAQHHTAHRVRVGLEPKSFCGGPEHLLGAGPWKGDEQLLGVGWHTRPESGTPNQLGDLGQVHTL